MAEVEAASAAEVNPNVDVGGEDVVTAKAGDAVTFDDLESLPIPAAKEKNESEDSDKKDDKEADTPDPATAKKEPDEKEPETTAQALDPEAAPDKETQPIKVVKGRYGDEEIELSHDTVFPTKVAGQMVDATLAELQQNYSGKINWEKRYQELSKSQKAHESTVTELNDFVSKMLTATQEDPLKFYDVVAEVAGQDSVKLKTDHLDGQIKALEKLKEMTEDEVSTWRNEQIFKFRQEAVESKEQRLQRREDQTKATVASKEVQDKYLIPDDEYRECLQLAKEHLKDREPTGDDAVTVHRHLMVLKAIENVEPKLAQKENIDDIVSDLRDVAKKNPTYKESDLEDIIRSVFDIKSRSQTLSNKLGKSKAGQTRVQAQQTTQKKELLTFDDLD